MYTNVGTQFDLSKIVQPVQEPGDARQDAVRFGINLTILAGDLIARLTSDSLMYRYDGAGAAGLTVAKGISMYSFKTDANGKVYFGETVPIVPDGLFSSPSQVAPYWKSGIFDPTELKIAGAATTTALIIAAFGAAFAKELPNSFVKIS